MMKHAHEDDGSLAPLLMSESGALSNPETRPRYADWRAVLPL